MFFSSTWSYTHLLLLSWSASIVFLFRLMMVEVGKNFVFLSPYEIHWIQDFKYHRISSYCSILSNYCLSLTSNLRSRLIDCLARICWTPSSLLRILCLRWKIFPKTRKWLVVRTFALILVNLYSLSNSFWWTVWRKYELTTPQLRRLQSIELYYKWTVIPVRMW